MEGQMSPTNTAAKTASTELTDLTATIAKVTGMRFCTKCNITRRSEGGKTKMMSNGRIRWMCRECAQKKSTIGFVGSKR